MTTLPEPGGGALSPTKSTRHVTPKTRTPRRPTWRTAKSTLVPLMTSSRPCGPGGEAPAMRRFLVCEHVTKPALCEILCTVYAVLKCFLTLISYIPICAFITTCSEVSSNVTICTTKLVYEAVYTLKHALKHL